MSARTGFFIGVAFALGVAVGFALARIPHSSSNTRPAATATVPTTPAVASNPAEERGSTEFTKIVVAGDHLMDAAKYPEAIAAYKRALAIRFDADVATDLGVCYRHAGDPNFALLAFREVIAKNPGHWEARYNAAVILLELGHLREAQPLIADLRRERPADASAAQLEAALAQAAAIPSVVHP